MAAVKGEDMKEKRNYLAALSNTSAASGASLASVFAFQTRHPVLGWLAAGVAGELLNPFGSVSLRAGTIS
jgi:hypothetical protein